ncbi:MAG: carboxypeptidase-like regulatory domain-containing protein, partial [Proteobacteria bacterium]|nr:carboxypeptidase-like regulatory domain-containing protein [Pseudomonadota bacterium]
MRVTSLISFVALALWTAIGTVAHAQHGGLGGQRHAEEVVEEALGDEAFDIIPGGVWLFGGYYRYTMIPDPFQEIFFDQAPFIDNHAGGFVITRRFGDGFSIVFGGGYLDYRADGYFRLRNDPWDDTEYVFSDLGLVHATASFLWAGDLTDWLAIEYGVGFDFGYVIGNIERTEAVYVGNRWYPCRGPQDPVVHLQNDPPNTPMIEPRRQYCEPPSTPGVRSDPAGERGAHYQARVERMSQRGQLPDVFLFPLIPHVAIRIAPVPEFTIKLEAGYSLLHAWAGASIHAGFEVAPTKVPRPVRVVERTVEIETRPPPKGRISGVVVEKGPGTPVSGATVKFTGSEFSPLVTDGAGAFTSYEFEPGQVAMELSHPDYEPGTCLAAVPDEGGVVSQRCELAAKPRMGNVDGRVVDVQGAPV